MLTAFIYFKLIYIACLQKYMFKFAQGLCYYKIKNKLLVVVFLWSQLRILLQRKSYIIYTYYDLQKKIAV